MTENHPRIVPVACLTVVMLIAPLTFAAVAVGEDAPPQEEQITFQMNAQHVGTGRSGQTPVSITITRWNTIDERDALEEILISRGMQALADELRSATEIGFIRAPQVSTTGWRLRYAMMFQGPEEGQRIIRIATDRPISFAEAVNRPVRSWDFNVSLIELIVDEEGNGEGTLMAGVEFKYDEENDSIGLKTLSSQPVRLVNVRRTR